MGYGWCLEGSYPSECCSQRRRWNLGWKQHSPFPWLLPGHWTTHPYLSSRLTGVSSLLQLKGGLLNYRWYPPDNGIRFLQSAAHFIVSSEPIWPVEPIIKIFFIVLLFVKVYTNLLSLPQRYKNNAEQRSNFLLFFIRISKKNPNFVLGIRDWVRGVPPTLLCLL